MEIQATGIHDNAKRYGFGTEIMKRLKVCTHCGSLARSDCYVCPKCGIMLPRKTLFHLYQSRHRLCPVCDTVLSSRMFYCPHCGMRQVGTGNRSPTTEADEGSTIHFIGGAGSC